MRSTAHERHVANGKRERRHVVLKQKADSAGARRRGQRVDVVAADLDRSTARPQRAGNAAQERRLSASVRAEHGEQLALAHVQSEVPQDLALTVVETRLANSDQRLRLLP